jgi:hypothetical protein
MRREWSSEDVVACWTLAGSDWDLVTNKSGPTRLGFVLMLKFFELEGEVRPVVSLGEAAPYAGPRGARLPPGGPR